MTIGLSKEEIIAILKENTELQSVADDGLFDKFAEVIVKNNEKLEVEINKPKTAVFG